ncbi:MAG: 3-methyladenine glycosylase [Marmoricola sp.]|nr:3-methyladenine glycosylase [Marmoricola sp.]
MLTLEREAWFERAEAHAARVDVWIEPYLERRGRGVAHPVHDFLFTYYAQRPAALRRWHPGYGTTLADAPEYAGLKGYADGTVTTSYLRAQLPRITAAHALLSATAARPPTLGCFGLHEWAMAYRSEDPGNEIRHGWPLRLGAGGTDEVVEGHRIGCSHFDAFRFFTPPARSLNILQPGRDDRPAYEQPGCLHAGMDLYKHAFRLSPLIASDLVADAFELAWDIRILDMRAAPYDFSGLILDPAGEPWTPVQIETPEGKAQYVAQQRAFSERGAPIRQALTRWCERMIATGLS